MDDNRRGRELVKLLRAVDLLARPQGITVQELAAGLELHERSARRWLATIEELGFPLVDEEGPGNQKRWRLMPDYVKKLPNLSLPDLKLSLAEAIGLHFAAAQSGWLAATEMGSHIETAMIKLAAFLPANLSAKLGQIAGIFVPTRKFHKDYAQKDEIIAGLAQAILERRTCKIGYDSFSAERTTQFRIDPLHLFEHSGGLYVFVRATAFNEIRTLAVERITVLEETSDRFTYPGDFNPEALRAAAFGVFIEEPIQVKIQFSGASVRYVRERIWASGQEIVPQSDGSVILSMRTSGLLELKRWVLSFGADARVLEPVELRTMVADEIRRMADEYPG